MRWTMTMIVTALLIVTAHCAVAEQRALLVGVGKYRIPGNNLPAIDIDLERMQKTLNLMGFEDSQIRQLLDEKATSKNVEKAFRTWLRDGVEPDDRVVFYFSGHGSYIPDWNEDEQDKADEVLVTHDASFGKRNGKSTLNGVVTDDTLATLIAAIPSNNILTIVDACHSGTVTRDFTMDNKRLGAAALYEKSLIYNGMPAAAARAHTRGLGERGSENFVSISAAGDGEKAIGTSQGGVFTMGLTQAIEEAARSGTVLSIQELREKSAAFIRANVDEQRVHTPQVTGSTELAGGSLAIIPLENGNGPNRKKLISLVDDTDNNFDFKANAGTYRLGQLLELTMTVPIDGYLNVVSVDSKDEATVLFPNRLHGDNEVPKGLFSFPTKKMAFDLTAMEPLGPTLLVAFVTRDRINFFEQNLDQRNEDGTINVDFTKLSTTATRGFGVTPKGKNKYATMLDVTVTQ